MQVCPGARHGEIEGRAAELVPKAGVVCQTALPQRVDEKAGCSRPGYNLPMKLEALILNSMVLSVTIKSTGTL